MFVGRGCIQINCRLEELKRKEAVDSIVDYENYESADNNLVS